MARGTYISEEIKILIKNLTSQGKSDKEISETLKLSVNTISPHSSNYWNEIMKNKIYNEKRTTQNPSAEAKRGQTK